MLQHITLHLARCPEFPEGSSERGYEFVAPLNASAHLDVEEWKHNRAQCRVRRFWPGESDRHGRLVHLGGGQGGTWAVRYGGQDSSEGETGVRLSTHCFAEGEYVSIRDDEGHAHTFKIARLRPLKATQQQVVHR
ncbi:hypothetical protein DYH55_20135 [Methylovirgula sp. 4M-Z18]|nr:hypothetical protein DYH55_20135 [Methylovirgula sp. 4M-Z18]